MSYQLEEGGIIAREVEVNMRVCHLITNFITIRSDYFMLHVPVLFCLT